MANSELFLQLSLLLEDSDDSSSDDSSSDDDMPDLLLYAAAEPFTRRLRQEIGRETLSIDRLKREAAAWMDDGDVSWNVYSRFGYHLGELQTVVDALEVPSGIRTTGGHVFPGEEAVLLLLRRFRSTDPLLSLTCETGRSISAISEVVTFMVEHITTTFPHLVDERSFEGYKSMFGEFADAFSEFGLPIDNLIGFIDGKLWPVCRPGEYQHVLYSGHKRTHGLKMQGIVFANGACRCVIC